MFNLLIKLQGKCSIKPAATPKKMHKQISIRNVFSNFPFYVIFFFQKSCIVKMSAMVRSTSLIKSYFLSFNHFWTFSSFLRKLITKVRILDVRIQSLLMLRRLLLSGKPWLSSQSVWTNLFVIFYDTFLTILWCFLWYLLSCFVW